MPNYHPVFLHGDRVRIFPHDGMEPLLSRYGALSWRLPPNPTQFVDTTGHVEDPHFDHGGHVLYSIAGVPGLWPEDWLVDCMLEDPMWTGYWQTSDYYSISVRTIRELSYVVLTDKSGADCLIKYSPFAAELAETMKVVAKRRHFIGFHYRYELQWVPSVHLTEGGKARLPQSPSTP